MPSALTMSALRRIFGLGQKAAGETLGGRQSNALTKGSSRLYPFTTSDLPDPSPTLWTALQQKLYLSKGLSRAATHFHGYAFPQSFLSDASSVTVDVFNRLSDTRLSADKESLEPVMSQVLARFYADGARAFKETGGLVPVFTLPSESPKLVLKNLHFTYGPYPLPPGYIQQDWPSLSLILPQEEAAFESLPQQLENVKSAQKEGVYIRATVQMNGPLTLRFLDAETGDIVSTHTRQAVTLEFSTPHFTPWDEIVELDAQGNWNLRWSWRLSDLDGLIASQAAPPLDLEKLEAIRKRVPAPGRTTELPSIAQSSPPLPSDSSRSPTSPLK